MESLAVKIYKSFLVINLYLLALLLLLGSTALRSIKIGGLMLGWSGMQVYLFCFCKTIGRHFDRGTQAGPARPPAGSGATFFRLGLLLLFLMAGGIHGLSVFLWTTGTALTVYFGWLGYLLYWHKRQTT